MYLELVEQIEQIQRGRIQTIGTAPNNGSALVELPAGGRSGFYFFYTSYTLAELQAGRKAPTSAAVPIDDLARKFGRLGRTFSPADDGFTLVYNGIGGHHGGSYNLRRRILQEISCQAERTGSLCIRQTTWNDLSRWRYSYVTMTGSTDDGAEVDLPIPWNFGSHAKDIETAWRLHYGWPLLCRR